MKIPVRILCLLTCCLMVGCSRTNQPDDGYVGSKSCIECHENFYHLWSSSHHGKAMQPYSDDLAKSNLTAQIEPIAIDNIKYFANIAPGKGFITETGPKRTKKYKIEHVMGGKNVYFFLTKLKRGRLQVMPLSYNINTKEWYDTTGSMVRHFNLEEDEALHWTDSLLTFNTACFNCHVSQLRKNYDLESDRYNTIWGEPGINCETCHGPCGEHNKAFRKANGKPLEDLKLLSWKTLTVEQKNDACNSCHAKAAPITPAFVPGEKFFDHYDLTCLEDNDFYPDGRDMGENYTLTSWLMSPCVKSGKLSCIHCHTSSGRYRFKNEKHNSACLPCHEKRVANIKSHSHHKMTKDTSPKCISCHMPMTTFGHMNRSDHSMRPPNPKASIMFKSPNACIQCHGKRDSEWAAKKISDWHPKEEWSKRIIHEGQLVQWAREEKWDHLQEIIDYIKDKESDDIVVTSLIRLLVACRDPKISPLLREMTLHSSPLVRSSVAVGLDAYNIESVRALLPLLDDEYRLVRIRAASTLMDIQREMLPPANRKRLEVVEKELVTSITCRPDHWSSHYNMGNHLGQLSDLSNSLKSYELAIKMRKDVVMPYVNASITSSRLGDSEKAYRYLNTAYALEPKSPAVNMNLGLLLAERGDLIGAEKHLREALNDRHSMPQAAYNLAVMIGAKNPAEAIKLCQQAVKEEPTNQKYQQALIYYKNQTSK